MNADPSGKDARPETNVPQIRDRVMATQRPGEGQKETAF
jgi:hypothetical protein